MENPHDVVYRHKAGAEAVRSSSVSASHPPVKFWQRTGCCYWCKSSINLGGGQVGFCIAIGITHSTTSPHVASQSFSVSSLLYISFVIVVLYGSGDGNAICLFNLMLQADSGIRATPPSQGNQKFDFGAFLKGDLPKKLLIMLVGTLISYIELVNVKQMSCLHVIPVP